MDPIDKQVAIDAVSRGCQEFRGIFAECEKNLNALQSAQPERKKGKWIKWDFKTFGAFGDWEYKCSNCEKVYGGEYNFCPNCGADMRGGADENASQKVGT